MTTKKLIMIAAGLEFIVILTVVIYVVFYK